MSDVGARLLAEARGVPYEDYRTERTRVRRSQSALARRYRFQAEPAVRHELDWEGRLRIVRKDVRTANEWEAFQAVLFGETMESLSDATGLCVSRVVRGLEGFERVPSGHTVRKYTVRALAVRRYW